MTLEVFWSDDALENQQGIFRFIASDNIQNAHLLADRIEHTISLLAEMPFGRAGRLRNTYEAVVPKTPFIIAYSLGKIQTLNIIRVIHGARDWKEGEWPK